MENVEASPILSLAQANSICFLKLCVMFRCFAGVGVCLVDTQYCTSTAVFLFFKHTGRCSGFPDQKAFSQNENFETVGPRFGVVSTTTFYLQSWYARCSVVWCTVSCR